MVRASPFLTLLVRTQALLMEVPPQKTAPVEGTVAVAATTTTARDANTLMAAANDAWQLDVAALHEMVHSIFAVIMKAGTTPLAKKDA